MDYKPEDNLLSACYQVVETVPSVEDFCRLRIIAGLTPRPAESVRLGLPNSCYAVHICWQNTVVGMGRIVGDGALNMEIVDVAVDPQHQGRGLGRKIMESLANWLDKNACDGAYVTLMADVPELYEKFDFIRVSPASEGMARIWKRTNAT
jgi:GNAT superfamily N-acetyltransferase